MGKLLDQIEKTNDIKQIPASELDGLAEEIRQFLIEKIKSDGEWALVVDQLNESLHEDCLK